MTSGMVPLVVSKYWIDNWHNRRSKVIGKSRFLYNHTELGIQRAKELTAYPNSEVRLLPKGFISPSHIYIFNDNLGITLWEKEYPFAILIKSKMVALRFSEFFEWFWKLGEPIKSIKKSRGFTPTGSHAPEGHHRLS